MLAVVTLELFSLKLLEMADLTVVFSGLLCFPALLLAGLDDEWRPMCFVDETGFEEPRFFKTGEMWVAFEWTSFLPFILFPFEAWKTDSCRSSVLFSLLISSLMKSLSALIDKSLIVLCTKKLAC